MNLGAEVVCLFLTLTLALEFHHFLGCLSGRRQDKSSPLHSDKLDCPSGLLGLASRYKRN